MMIIGMERGWVGEICRGRSKLRQQDKHYPRSVKGIYMHFVSNLQLYIPIIKAPNLSITYQLGIVKCILAKEKEMIGTNIILAWRRWWSCPSAQALVHLPGGDRVDSMVYSPLPLGSRLEILTVNRGETMGKRGVNNDRHQAGEARNVPATRGIEGAPFHHTRMLEPSI